MHEQIKEARQSLQTADQTLYDNRNRLRIREDQLARARRRGAPGAAETERLEKEIDALQQVVGRNKAALLAAKDRLNGLVGEFVLPKTPQQLVAELDDRLPLVLLPLRIETRFLTVNDRRELWVRAFPDDIAIHTHEKALARDEADAGLVYWTEIHWAALVESAAERERLEKGAWRALTEAYGAARSAWIAAEIRRPVRERVGEDDLSFLLIRPELAAILNDPALDNDARRAAVGELLAGPNPAANTIAQRLGNLTETGDLGSESVRRDVDQAARDGLLIFLGFDLDALKAESWSRAPRSEVMPDRLVLVGLTGGQTIERSFPQAIPDPLILGPNPQELEAELTQTDGELLLGEDFAWLSHFDKAIEMGMAMRLPLEEPFASQGFDQLMVLGIRLSSVPEEHRSLLEELVDNHHYAPEGMSFLPQGTPTNNTGDTPSGFSRTDPGGEQGFAVETGAPNFELTEVDLDKSDAQRFAEALDISPARLEYIEHAGRQDVSEAKWINKALWPATLGYFLEELLELDNAAIGSLRQFFADHVQGRGSLPAIRIGKQPYGLLVTSAFNRWQVNAAIDGESASFLTKLQRELLKLETQWQALTPRVSHVGASGDSFGHLLNMLGLHATSVEFSRRYAPGQTHLWNYAQFFHGRSFSVATPTAESPAPGGNRGINEFVLANPVEWTFREINRRARLLFNDIFFTFHKIPKILQLVFFDTVSPLATPLVDDVEDPEDEQFSETTLLPARYRVQTGEAEEQPVFDQRNYVGWLVRSDIDTLKQHTFLSADERPLAAPKPLLYRLLHRSLLLSVYRATMDLYVENELLTAAVRQEQDFTNIEEERTVTRWEFMDARINRVLPQVSQADLSVAGFLSTPEGLQLPVAFPLAEVRECIGRLENLPTARLERLLAEHVDLCSYRLDAWQSGLFTQRLEALNRRRTGGIGIAAPRRVNGVHLGAYGYLEDLRPAPAPVAAPLADIPASLREEGVTVVEQAGNGGFIHGPSINHAVTAAVLRNAYLTHADENRPEHFAVNLSSERVRTALSFLEGVRNGQELGALLGYQFERGLHDRFVIAGESLEQYILPFREKYPLLADKITPDADKENIGLKEAHFVLDGYALVEAAFLDENPLSYPYGIDPAKLPTPGSAAANALVAEVERLAASLDAIADLALAEGVYQVTQGNYDRAGAMLKALSEGNAPPEPDIARTPRSGHAIHQKVSLHLETGPVASPWGGPSTPQARAEPGLNKWLGQIIGPPDKIRFRISYDLDGDQRNLPLAILGLQAIDLVFLLGDEQGSVRNEQPINSLTEIEQRIDYHYRRQRRGEDSFWDSSGRTTIHFRSREGFDPDDHCLFELLPLLRRLRYLVTHSRALGADDYALPSEESLSPVASANSKGWDPSETVQKTAQALTDLSGALTELKTFIDALPDGILAEDPAAAGLDSVDYDALRNHLIRLANFGIPDAFPNNAVFPLPAPGAGDEERLALARMQQELIRQAFRVHDQVKGRHEQAASLKDFAGLSPEEIAALSVDRKIDQLQRAAQLIFNSAFKWFPTFTFPNLAELQAAAEFSASGQLLRHSGNPLIVEEWMQGVGRVQEKVGLLEETGALYEALRGEELILQALQLPFEEKAFWVAVEFPEVSPQDLDNPEVFVPAGDYLSVVRHLPAGYDLGDRQAGLLIDEWAEVIPNQRETTGIAVHYDQPNTEPPQTILLAVSPNVTGNWDWDDLVAIVQDTFARAKRRAVEPDHLLATPYAQLLPAILSAVTRHPFATISTQLAAEATV